MPNNNQPQGLKKQLSQLLSSLQYERNDNFFYIVLLSAPILITLYRYIFEAQNFMAYFPSLNEMPQGEIYAYGLEYLSFFVW